VLFLTADISGWYCWSPAEKKQWDISKCLQSQKFVIVFGGAGYGQWITQTLPDFHPVSETHWLQLCIWALPDCVVIHSRDLEDIAHYRTLFTSSVYRLYTRCFSSCIAMGLAWWAKSRRPPISGQKIFWNNLTDLQISGIGLHKNAFGSRALPGPAGVLPQTS